MYVDFSKAIDYLDREKNDVNTSYTWSSKETDTAIIMFYKDINTMVHSSDGVTDFFDKYVAYYFE